MNYTTVIGLECHVELSTKTKAYCSCSTEFGGLPNTHVCPVCLGLPGALPVINKEVVSRAIKAGLALNCNITPYQRYDRKNYFYPDTPKNYQITQQALPICTDGWVEIDTQQGKKKIRIERIHMEEDAGKQLHTKAGTLVDYNRAGVPLIEIVTRPDLRSKEEATAFMTKLRAILQAIGVSDVRMEEGSLRVDLNVSLMPEGSETFGVRAEIKNLNSFKAMEKAVAYETQRQAQALAQGEEMLEQTRRWDEACGQTLLMRSKEMANDYRYFPEGDLVGLAIDDEWIERVRATLPELPHDQAERFVRDYGISAYDAMVLTQERAMAQFFDEAAALSGDGKACANWLMGDVSRLLNEEAKTAQELTFTPKDLYDLTVLIAEGTISNAAGKKVLEAMFHEGKKPQALVESLGLAQVSDEDELLREVQKALDANPKVIEDYRNGKTKIVGFAVGLVMKATKGKANPSIINRLVSEEVEKRARQ
ncbi:Aspartyl-tRNA(Asn) amidotransferase subunit B [Clostridiaceae bacterium JG1575]|nr:Aspartyl-tRNA(Asn) amidotransferase subunit B [Clostridiaceae bacterium JG1575]